MLIAWHSDTPTCQSQLAGRGAGQPTPWLCLCIEMHLESYFSENQSLSTGCWWWPGCVAACVHSVLSNLQMQFAATRQQWEQMGANCCSAARRIMDGGGNSKTLTEFWNYFWPARAGFNTCSKEQAINSNSNFSKTLMDGKWLIHPVYSRMFLNELNVKMFRSRQRVTILFCWSSHLTSCVLCVSCVWCVVLLCYILCIVCELCQRRPVPYNPIHDLVWSTKFPRNCSFLSKLMLSSKLVHVLTQCRL